MKLPISNCVFRMHDMYEIHPQCKSFFNDINFKRNINIDLVLKKILDLSVDMQLHILHYILDVYYNPSSSDIIIKNVTNLFNKKEFRAHRDLLYQFAYDECINFDKVLTYANELGVDVEYDTKDEKTYREYKIWLIKKAKQVNLK